MPYPPMPPSPFPPYHRWYTDVEPAYEKPAECDCHFPPVPDNCVCVTEEDANNWNGAYNIISAVSAGLDIQAITSAASLLTSADFWNQVYTEVSANSALWNTLPAVSAKLAETAQYAVWLASTLSANGVKHDDTLSGDGVVVPLSVAYSERFDQLYEQFLALTADFDVATIMEAMSKCKTDLLTQIAELSGGHIQNFELIQQLMAATPSSGNVQMTWVNAQDMDPREPNTYTDKNTPNYMYFSTYSA